MKQLPEAITSMLCFGGLLMAATTLISRELLVRTVDLAADLFLVTLGLKRRFLLRLGTFHFGICARSSAKW